MKVLKSENIFSTVITQIIERRDLPEIESTVKRLLNENRYSLVRVVSVIYWKGNDSSQARGTLCWKPCGL